MSRSSRTVYVSVRGTTLRETEKAVLFRFTHVRDCELEHSKAEWIPISQVSKRFVDLAAAGKDTMMVAEWILEKNGVLELPLKEGHEDPPDVEDTYDRFNGDEDN